MKRILTALLALTCGAWATTEAPMSPQDPAPPATTMQAPTAANGIVIEKIPTSVPQASLLMGVVPTGSSISYDGRAVRVAPNGRFVLGVAREQTGSIVLKVTASDGSTRMLEIAVTPRVFRTERINGVPESTVNPPPEIAARIQREQAEVEAARTRDDDRTDFDTVFIWPVKGRITGWFGSERIYNGTPKSPHSGVDVAAPKGTPIHAPAGGIVTFANPDLYLTGGTVLIDHGHGVSSNLIHMSRIDVKVGDRVEQGQVVGLVGATGRATGPHMHWGMNWFNVRVDPQSLMPPGDAK
jgi:murein DD-endopeptidase MepM/ murein hydrolase activator NlpD